MSFYDLRDDVQAQPQPLPAAGLPLTAAKRIEQMPDHVRRYRAAVFHDQRDPVRGATLQLHSHGLFWIAVFQGIADQIGGDLGDTLGIPFAVAIPCE